MYVYGKYKLYKCENVDGSIVFEILLYRNVEGRRYKVMGLFLLIVINYIVEIFFGIF